MYLFFFCNQRNSHTFLICSSCAADSVHVIVCVIRCIYVYYMAHVCYVQSPCHQICCYKYSMCTILEILEGIKSVILGFVGMDQSHVVREFWFQFVKQQVGQPAIGREYKHFTHAFVRFK